jgi:hypothetical protein
MSTEAQEHSDKTPEPAPGDSTPQQIPTPVDSACPQCGGPPHRKWKDLFTLNLATFFIFGALAPFLLSFFMALRASARDLAVHIFSHWFGSTLNLRFAAEPNDIERFIEDSPSLKGLSCRTYSRDRMRLAYEDLGDASDDSVRSIDYDHDHFVPRDGAPKWYKEEIRGKGRRYEIKAWGGDWWGELIVDDEQHVVYVRICR